MPRSRIDSKGRTTIPQAVRNALNLKPGDELAYQIEDGRVVLMRAERAPLSGNPCATFNEWGSESDIKAYKDL